MGSGPTLTPATVYLASGELRDRTYEKKSTFIASAMAACRTATAMISKRTGLLSPWGQPIQRMDSRKREPGRCFAHFESASNGDGAYMKYPELIAPSPTNTQRRIPTGIRHSRLIGTNTLIAYPYTPRASATPHSPTPSHLVAPHRSAGTPRP
jgi:hypothetical protein